MMADFAKFLKQGVAEFPPGGCACRICTMSGHADPIGVRIPGEWRTLDSYCFPAGTCLPEDDEII